MRTLFLCALAFSLTSSSSSEDSPSVCFKDHLDGTWSRRAPFNTSAHIHYTNEDQEGRDSSLAFYIKEKWRTIFVMKLFERKGTAPTVNLEFYDKNGLNSIIQGIPTEKQTLQPPDQRFLDISLVNKKWKLRLANGNNVTMAWNSSFSVYTGEGGDLSVQAFAETPHTVTLPCGYSECPEELVSTSLSNKWRVPKTPALLQCTVLERNVPVKYNFFVEEDRRLVADVEVQITNKAFGISIKSGGRKKTCSFDAKKGGPFFTVDKPQRVVVTYSEGHCKIELKNAFSYDVVECSSEHAPTKGTGTITLQVKSETDVVVKLPCGYGDVTNAGGLLAHHILLTIICLTLVALIVLACCVWRFLSWGRRRRFTPKTRKSSISKT